MNSEIQLRPSDGEGRAMRRRGLVIVLSVLAVAGIAQANPIALRATPYGDLTVRLAPLAWAAILVAICIEYLVFRLFTNKAIGSLWGSMGIFLGIHVISFPLTQVVYEMFWLWVLPPDIRRTRIFGGIQQSIWLGILTEVVPITLEALWYRWWIGRKCPGYGMKRAWATSFVSNAASYAAGLVFINLASSWVVSHTPR